MPIGGYTKIFEKLLNNIEIKLNTDYFKNKEYFNNIANNIIYSGRIDEFYDFNFGKLEYRTLNFETIRYDINDYQGCAVINYTDIDVPYTRIIEHKHFERQENELSYTYVTKETPINWNNREIPYYPINNMSNNLIYEKYKNLSLNEKNIIFGGRLGEYKYYNMWEVINNALNIVNKIKNEKY